MANAFPIQQLSQHSEKLATLVNNPDSQLFYRYAYGRSADSRKNDDAGQDYVAICEQEDRLAFALCDGVSQSFFGDLAASFIGNNLVTWMFDLPDPRNSNDAWRMQLESHLQNCIQVASREVADYKYPENTPGMIQMVLEKKRLIGSESTFVAGVIDLSQGWYALAWMGDTRLRLWDAQREITAVLGDTFQTRERWSSNKGLVGDLHTHFGNIEDITHVLVYSDGLSVLDKPIQGIGCSNEALDNIIEETCLQPNSDDTSLFEWWSGAPQFHMRLEKPVGLQRKRPFYEWRSVENATMYEIGLCREEFTKIAVHYKTEPKTSFAEDELNLSTALYIRAWNHDEPGEIYYSMLESFPKDSAAESVNSRAEIPAAPQLLQISDQKVSLPPKPVGIIKNPANPPQIMASDSQRDVSSEQPTGPFRQEKKRKHSRVLWIVVFTLGIGILIGVLWLTRLSKDGVLGIFGSPTETAPIPTATVTKTVTPTPSQTPLPSDTPEPTLLPTSSGAEVPTGEATPIETPQTQVETPTNPEVIRTENIELLQSIPGPVFEKTLSYLLFASGDEEENDSWLALAIYGSNQDAVLNSEIYKASATQSWARIETLKPFELAAFTHEYAAGVVKVDENTNEIYLWSENDGKWELNTQPIAQGKKTCALLLDGDDLYTLDTKGNLRKHPLKDSASKELDILEPWDNLPSSDATCSLAIFEDANSERYLVASHGENYRIVSLTISNPTPSDSRMEFPITSLEFLKPGWLVGSQTEFYFLDQDFKPVPSANNQQYSTYAIHRANEIPFLVALNAPTEELPNCFYLGFTDGVPELHILDPERKPDFCNADNLFFTPDGKFLVTLSSETGVMIWFNNGLE